MEPSLLLCPGKIRVHKKKKKKTVIPALKRSQPSVSHSNGFSPGFYSPLVIRDLFLLLIKIPLTSNLFSHSMWLLSHLQRASYPPRVT